MYWGITPEVNAFRLTMTGAGPTCIPRDSAGAHHSVPTCVMIVQAHRETGNRSAAPLTDHRPHEFHIGANNRQIRLSGPASAVFSYPALAGLMSAMPLS